MAKTVTDLQREANERHNTKVRIYNPDSEDFKCSYAGEEYVIFSREIDKFDGHIANHIKKHLANKLLNKRGIPDGSNTQRELRKIRKEISVTL